MEFFHLALAEALKAKDSATKFMYYMLDHPYRKTK